MRLMIVFEGDQAERCLSLIARVLMDLRKTFLLLSLSSFVTWSSLRHPFQCESVMTIQIFGLYRYKEILAGGDLVVK
jgi:hypothetical protein